MIKDTNLEAMNNEPTYTTYLQKDLALYICCAEFGDLNDTELLAADQFVNDLTEAFGSGHYYATTESEFRRCEVNKLWSDCYRVDYFVRKASETD